MPSLEERKKETALKAFGVLFLDILAVRLTATTLYKYLSLYVGYKEKIRILT